MPVGRAMTFHWTVLTPPARAFSRARNGPGVIMRCRSIAPAPSILRGWIIPVVSSTENPPMIAREGVTIAMEKK